MQVTIRNDALTVVSDTHGAELHTIDSANGISYLWNGDPAYWSYHAPTLFPFIGALRGGCAASAGGEIRLPKHGLARTAEWTLESASETAVTYLLTANDQTRAGYPYDFEVRIRYHLEGASITTTYTVKNAGSNDMPFCIGGHPAFRVPLTEGECFEDYRIVFAQPETADCPQVDLAAGLIIRDVRNRLLTESASFALHHVLFRGDALIFDRLKSRSVQLLSSKSGHGVRMDFAGMDYFAVWSPFTDAPFVCLEPWTGTATCVEEDDIFEHKQGVRVLSPGEQATYAFTVTVF